MSALTIAFDTVIVGVLALSWVALVIHLFFSRWLGRIEGIADWVKSQNQPAAAGVLLFAMAYFLGSIVSRMAQDFFDDDDLWGEFGGRRYELVSEGSIRANVYCGDRVDGEWLAPIYTRFPDQSSQNQLEDDCALGGRANDPTWLFVINKTDLRVVPYEKVENLKKRVGNVFDFQESTLLLKGEDMTSRLRQLHDQTNVLRGAAFDGLIAFSLCLFAWCANFPAKWRFALGIVPLVYLSSAVLAFIHHFSNRTLSEPPFMEFTLLVLGVTGIRALWKGGPSGHRHHPAGLLLFLLLFAVTACLSWWMTDVLYEKQVISSYYASFAIK